MSASLSPVEVLQSDANWSVLYTRLSASLLGDGGIPVNDPGEPVEGATMTPLERYARAVSDTSSPGIALALTLPLTMVSTSMATQGGLWLKIEQPGGYMLKIPCILQATVMAPSGYGKSTIVDPLADLLRNLNKTGIVERRKIVAKKLGAKLASLAAAKEEAKKPTSLKAGLANAKAVSVGIEEDEASVKKQMAYGLAKSFVMDSGTPEAVRRTLLRGGGMCGIWTAEPDVLREISSYAKDGGTFRWLLDGWGGSSIGVARADREMLIPRTSLPYAIVVQPASFDQFNAARQQSEGANDSAIGRGLYGRSWLIRINGWESATKAFGMNTSVDASERVAKALASLELNMETLTRRTNAYRVQMGMVIGWEESSSRDEEGDGDIPDLPEQDWLTLAEDAMWDYTMLQNVRLAFIEEVTFAAVERPGIDKLLMPMVTRLTQHGMRLAMTLQLSHDPLAKEVQGWAVRDACLRLMPWLLEHWAAEMHRYAAEGAQAQLEMEIRNNMKGDDYTFDSRIAKALSTVVDGAGGGDGVQFSQGAVVAAAKSQVRSSARSGLTAGLNEAFELLVKRGWVVKVEGTGGGGRAGSVKYVKTNLGIAAGL